MLQYKRSTIKEYSKFHFVGMMIRARADEKQSSALKICIAVGKEKGSEKHFSEPKWSR